MRHPDVFQIDRQSSAQARDHEVTFNRTHALCATKTGKSYQIDQTAYKTGPVVGWLHASAGPSQTPTTSTKRNYVFVCSLQDFRFEPPTHLSSKIIQTSTMATSLRLLRAPAANLRVAAPRLSGARAFATSQILRQATVAVPTKRPVGAFRGGYVLYTILRHLPRRPLVVGSGRVLGIGRGRERALDEQSLTYPGNS